MTIAEKIKRAAEFELAAAKIKARTLFSDKNLYTDTAFAGFLNGAREESARLTPLISALADCVSALEGMTKYGANDVTINNGERALSRLTQLLPEGEE